MRRFLFSLVVCLGLGSALSQASEGPKREFLSSWRCDAHRPNPADQRERLDAIIFFDLVKMGDNIVIEKFVGHVDDTGYYGVFNHKNLANKPFVRTPTKYKEHFRFDVNASETAGAEDGMWGTWYVPMAMQATRKGPFEAHYMYQAGDHRGNTIHLTCDSTY